MMSQYSEVLVSWYNKRMIEEEGTYVEEALKQINKLRQTVMLRLLLSWGLAGFGFLLIFRVFSLGMTLIIIGFIAGLVTSMTARKQYAAAYKKEIVQAVLERFFDDLTMETDGGFREDWVSAQHFIPTGNRFSSDDLICGSYRGCPFRRSDVCTQQVTSTGKTTTVTTLFEGPWMIFQFPKEFTHYLLVREKEFLANGKPGGWFSGLHAEKIRMESEPFNAKFEVYAENEHEAFYLLTPHFMEKLEQAEQEIKGRMYYGFIGSEFHVAVDNHENSFEPPVFSAVTESDLKDIEHQARLIGELIEVLQLDVRDRTAA